MFVVFYGICVIYVVLSNVNLEWRRYCTGDQHSFDVRFRQVVDYPLDVYFLLDMSFTMRKYQESLSNLASTLGNVTLN